MPNLDAFELAIVYTSGKRYIVPMSILKDVLNQEQIDKIKTLVLKEIAKN